MDVPNPRLVLIPGMYAEVESHAGSQRNQVLAVPVSRGGHRPAGAGDGGDAGQSRGGAQG